jgi:hypothetical protein
MIWLALSAAASFWQVPAHAQPVDVLLMRAWYVQNDTCRGSPEPTPACRWREDTGRVLAARGWSWSSRYGWRRVK